MAHQKSYGKDNGPQFASPAFANCNIEWGFTPETSCQHYTQSIGFAQSCVKIVKHNMHTLQHAKYSGTNPRIALQHLKVTPVDAKLPPPSQMLYNHRIHTTILSRINNTDPAALQVQEHLEDWAEHAKSCADKGSKPLAQCYAGQPIATFDTWRKIWIPTTVVCVLPKNSYQVQTASRTSIIPDATCRNTVKEAMMLSPRPHQPHQGNPGMQPPCRPK